MKDGSVGSTITSGKRIFIASCGILAIYLVSQIVIQLLIEQAYPGLTHGTVLSLTFILGMIIAVPAAMYLRKKADVLPGRCSPGQVLKVWLPGTAGVISTNALVVILADAAGASGYFDPGAASSMTETMGVSALSLLGACVCGPITEEYVFRGTIFASLRRRTSFWTAGIISALLFGVLHGGIAALAACLSGLLICYVYERTGSLLPGIMIHITNNLWVFLSSLLSTHKANTDVYASVGPAGVIIAAAIAVLSVLIIRKITEGIHCQNE